MRTLLILAFITGFSLFQSSPIAALQACNGFNSRLTVSQTVRVITPELNIRVAAGTNADRVRDPLTSGMQVTLIDGPVCVDGFTWWAVTAAGSQGWVAEGNQSEYFLSTSFASNSSPSNLDWLMMGLDETPGAGERFLTCEGGFYEDSGLTGRASYSEDNISNGGTISFTPTAQVLEVDYPAICINANIPFNGQAVALGPDGQRLPPLISEYNGGSHQIQLPPAAVVRGGAWRLEVQGFSLSVDIALPNHPFVFMTYADNGIMMVAGLQSNERFIISGKPRGDENPQYLEAEADENGVYAHPLSQVPWVNDFDPNRLYRAVITSDVIGQLGSVYMYGGFIIPNPLNEDRRSYAIPSQYAAPIITEIVWGQIMDTAAANQAARNWTCPGGLPIRLNGADLNPEAIVIADAGRQTLYRQPSLNATVEGSMDPGSTVRIEFGVECSDGAVWWRTNNGWMMESQNGRYLLQPLD